MRKHSRKQPVSEEESLPEWPNPVQGGKYVRLLQEYVRQLRSEHPHGNQELFADDVVLAHLLAFYNPTLRSLRTIEDFSQTRQARRHLSIGKICKSTLSDFHRLVDPLLLQPIVTRLHAEARKQGALPTELPAMLGHVLAVDGSYFALAADVAWAVRHRTNSGHKCATARLDVHLDVRTWLPEIINVCGNDTPEAENAARHVTANAIHVYDRGIFSFELLEAQIKANAYFVHRLRKPSERQPQFLVEEERALDAVARQAGVIADRLGRLKGSTHRQAPEAVLREVTIVSPDQPDGEIRLLTNLTDIEPHLLGLLYRHRWQVELFFRWLKVFANFEHLISESRSGVLFSFYVAVIGIMLMYLFTHAKPSKYAFSLLALAARGGASLEEIAPILKERERQIARDKASLARRRARRENN